MLAITLCVAVLLSSAQALDNGLARTPQMGWNSWNYFACNVNESVIMAAADAMISSGLAAVGYQYINVDDCWAEGRFSNGTIYPEASTFPTGMKALADYVHSKGLKFGLYSDAGNNTCAGRPGSLGYETIDADTYASWGVDYLKYDNCNSDNIPPQTRYPVMRDALNATGRHIFYSMCEWGVDNPWTWAPPVGNSWRCTGDIKDSWVHVVAILADMAPITAFAGPGGWNDPDMLEVGNGGMSNDEYMTHFSLWAMLKAPLIIGCDMATMSADTLAILANTEVIAVNQDPLGKSAARIKRGITELWAGPLANGSVVAAVINYGPLTVTGDIEFSDIGMPGAQVVVRDLWKHQTMGTFSTKYSADIPSHGVLMVLLTQEQGTSGAAIAMDINE